MATKKMLISGSILGKYPNVNVKKRIKQILKEYKEALKDVSVEDYEKKNKRGWRQY